MTEKMHTIASCLVEYYESIENWFSTKKLTPILYASSDVRHSSYKISVVDTNIFPGGFNNLLTASLTQVSEKFKNYFSHFFKDVRRILIIPESHTRNLPYLENLAALKFCLEQVGFKVEIGSLITELRQSVSVELENWPSLVFKPLERKDNQITVENFVPELLLLNNDLSEGIPEILNFINIPMVPNPYLGWWNRSKSSHFKFYNQCVTELSKVINLDPWFLSADYEVCENINFLNNEGMENLIEKTEKIIQNITEKYKEYGISDKPYAIIKADTGTYGMAVMPVNDSSILKNLNRKQRQNMAQVKGGNAVHRVLIQEGIYTQEISREGFAAEPVLYSVNGEVIGAFYRYHKIRTAFENLNSPGMQFEPLSMIQNSSFLHEDLKKHPAAYAYQVAARLALLALEKESLEISRA